MNEQLQALHRKMITLEQTPFYTMTGRLRWQGGSVYMVVAPDGDWYMFHTSEVATVDGAHITLKRP